MQIIYVPETIIGDTRRPIPTTPNSIFLAGPTPRDEKNVASWRPEALKILREMGFTGTVFIPEARGGGWANNYDLQVKWEWMALAASACVVVWVPRELETMPAFTTNVEHGFISALRPDRLAFGYPDGTPKNRYLESMVTDMEDFHSIFGTWNKAALNGKRSRTLRDVLTHAMKKASRFHSPECC
ncbi:MAG: hypothetical protein OSB62_01955 [Alphaproteobacteria bacterium]|nr:hypothetical protein [Alphaproteobacteria bacterium]